VVHRARYLIYLSHLFCRCAENAWQFCLVLFLAAICNYESVVLVSTYGLWCGLLECTVGAKAGRFVDETNRLTAATFFVWTQNTCVCLATFSSWLILSRMTTTTSSVDESNRSLWLDLDGCAAMDATSICLLVAIHLFGSIAKVLDGGFTVAIERDWIVVMSEVVAEAAEEEEEEAEIDAWTTTYNSSSPQESAPTTTTTTTVESRQSQWLTETNVTMKQIDLSCKIVAPTVAGLVVGGFGKNNIKAAAVLIGLINGTSLVVEYVCVTIVYRMIPKLAQQAKTEESDNDDEAAPPEMETKRACLCEPPSGLVTYFSQSISWGGLALALL